MLGFNNDVTFRGCRGLTFMQGSLNTFKRVCNEEGVRTLRQIMGSKKNTHLIVRNMPPGTDKIEFQLLTPAGKKQQWHSVDFSSKTENMSWKDFLLKTVNGIIQTK